MEFYVRLRTTEKDIAEKVTGKIIDSDTFIYHSTNKHWYIVDIKTGLSVVYGNTKKECLEKYEKNKDKYTNVKNSCFYDKRVKEFIEILEGRKHE